jgi:predicted membrane-bound spermidine synthase
MNYEFIKNHKYLVINFITLLLGCISAAFGYGFKFDIVLYSITSTLLVRYVILPNIKEVSKSFFRGVKEGLHEIATVNTAGFNLRSVAIRFGDHFTGISACFYSAMQDPSTKTVVAELVKVGSFLGIEIPIVNVITSKAAQIAENAIRVETLEDCIPLIGTVTALTGQEISGVSMDAFLQKQARNITNIKIIQEQIRTVFETSGIV